MIGGASSLIFHPAPRLSAGLLRRAFQLVSGLCYLSRMEEKNRTLWDKRKDETAEYKKGVREGWDQAMWAVIALCVLVYFLVQWFPD